MNRKGIQMILAFALLALAALAGDPQTNPLLDAKEGEWAVYDLEGQMELKVSIIEVTDDAVTIRTESTKDGEVVHSNDMTFPKTTEEIDPEALKDMPPDFPQPKYSEETIEVNGKSLKCTVVEINTEFENTRSWVSNDVPVKGLVKLETDGTVTQTLVDWGIAEPEPPKAPETEKPAAAEK